MSDFQDLFSEQDFNQLGSELLDQLTIYLRDCTAGDVKVIDWQPAVQAEQDFISPLPRGPRHAPSEWLGLLSGEVLSRNLRVHHPRNLGHQVAPPLPLSALADLVSALTNQAMAIYETGPSATLIERQVVRWMAELIGFGVGAEGVLTSGGAQANLTALLAARQCKAGADVWKSGVRTAPPLYILASEHAHYSVSRAAGIMGLGTDAVIAVNADLNGRMDMTALMTAHDMVLRSGGIPFVVVATAGCTPTGSIDPLNEIADFCARQGLWMHVDGAHGASGLLTDQYRSALAGIERADSVVWDGHKLLYMPATVSAVIYREGGNSYAAFAQEASYLFQGGSDEAESYNTSYRTLECTKRMMGLKLWSAFSVYGTNQLGGVVEHVYGMARQFAEVLTAVPDFELLMQPQTNIVCFRYIATGIAEGGQLDSLQASVRRRLVESGAFHLTQARIHGAIWLRTTIMNPLTQMSDLEALLQTVRKLDLSS